MATLSGDDDTMLKTKTAACDVCDKVVVKRCMLRHQRTNKRRSVGRVDLRTDCEEANVTTDCEEANLSTISLVSALNTCTPGHHVRVSDLILHQYYKVLKLEKVDSTILATWRHLGGFNVCYVYLPRHFGDILPNDIISRAFDVIHLINKDNVRGETLSCGASLELHYPVRYVRTQIGEPCVAWCLQPVERSL
ncbi:hypothetical protein J6590_035830 [Homalodisca vitripennis]|nr:hypothetical protein J6590_035830 [Homalodisca vitripennis]